MRRAVVGNIRKYTDVVEEKMLFAGFGEQAIKSEKAIGAGAVGGIAEFKLWRKTTRARTQTPDTGFAAAHLQFDINRVGTHEARNARGQKGFDTGILPEKTQCIGRAVFPDFEEIAVGCCQVLLIGQQVNAQQIGGGRGKTEPEIERPQGAVRDVALRTQLSSTGCGRFKLQFFGVIDNKTARIARPDGVCRKITIGEIVGDLGAEAQRRAKEKKELLKFHFPKV